MNTFIEGYKIIHGKFGNKISILIVISVFSALLEAIGLVLIFPLFKLLTNKEINLENPYFDFSNYVGINFENTEIIFYISILFLLLIFFKNIFLILGSYIQTKILLQVKYFLSSFYFSKLLDQKFLGLMEQDNASTIRTMISQTDIFSANFIHASTVIIVEAIFFIFILSFTIILVEKEFLYVLFIITFFLVTYYFFFKKIIYNLSKKNEVDQIYKLKNLDDGINSINEISIFNLKKLFSMNESKTNYRLIGYALKISLIRIFPKSIIEVLLVGIFVLFILFMSANNINFIEFVPSLAVLTAALLRFMPIINKFMISFQKINSSKPVVENICNKFKTFEKNQAINDQKVDYKFDKKIVFKNLSFSYNNSKEKIFENCNFEINKNQKIGIYGDTGSGKSTLVKILLGMISPSDGRITIDDQELFEDNKNWQSKLSYIPQKIFLIDTPLKRNIDIFDENNDQKFEKIISKVFENKKTFDRLSKIGDSNKLRLSGGEIKKIGIARALYKDHELMIIDEGTTGLDNAYITYIIDQILKLDKTVIFISHDLNQIKKFEAVYKIENKKLISAPLK
tara:strand:- start:13760 stop:15466 length:1707 start_codon:yes stop_codon:yes gene_type:complete